MIGFGIMEAMDGTGQDKGWAGYCVAKQET